MLKNKHTCRCNYRYIERGTGEECSRVTSQFAKCIGTQTARTYAYIERERGRERERASEKESNKYIQLPQQLLPAYSQAPHKGTGRMLFAKFIGAQAARKHIYIERESVCV